MTKIQLIQNREIIQEQYNISKDYIFKWKNSPHKMAIKSYFIRAGKYLKNFIYDIDEEGIETLIDASIVNSYDRKALAIEIWNNIQEYSIYRDSFKMVFSEIYSDLEEMFYEMSIWLDAKLVNKYKNEIDLLLKNYENQDAIRNHCN